MISTKLRPDYYLRDIFAITPEWLEQHGLRAVFTDLDNTLAGYGACVPDTAAGEWLRELPRKGFPVVVISNGRKDRVEGFCDEIPCIYRAGKPRPDTLLITAKALRLKPVQVLMVGDQIRTDIRAAKRAGMKCAWVHPFAPNWFHRLRYCLELLWVGRE